MKVISGRLFIEAGALCWPNGLELSPSRLYEKCMTTEASLMVLLAQSWIKSRAYYMELK